MPQAMLPPSGTGAETSSPDLYGKPSWQRRAAQRTGWAICLAFVCLIAAPLASVLWTVLAHALPVWHWSVLWQPGTGEGGGLENEILGTLVIVAGVVIVAGTLGVCSGTYLSEYSTGRLGALLRTGSEVLAGIPSIVFGYVGYLALVVGLHWQFSLGAALVTLSALTVPYIAKSTESALRQVPTTLREGADALGMPPLYALRRVTMKSALPGVATGLLIAVAIAVGETAPLLYTAGFTDRAPGLGLTHAPVAYLTYAVWTFYNYPSTAFQDLSYDAALILVVLVVVLIVVSRLLVSLTQRHADRS